MRMLKQAELLYKSAQGSTPTQVTANHITAVLIHIGFIAGIIIPERIHMTVTSTAKNIQIPMVATVTAHFLLIHQIATEHIQTVSDKQVLLQEAHRAAAQVVVNKGGQLK